MQPANKKDIKRKRGIHANNYFLKVARLFSINLEKQKFEDGVISINNIINIIKGGAFYLVIIIFTFPVAIPLPYPPGFPSICAVPIFLLSFQMLINRKGVILPKFIKEYKIRVSLIRMLLKKANKIFRLLSKMVKPGRLSPIVSDKFTVLYGILFITLSICILIPLPGTNFIPAVSIFICSIGILFKDGLLTLIGIVIGIIGIIIVYFFSAFFAGILSRFFRFTYSKVTNLYVEETTFFLTLGVLIGCFTMFVLYGVIKVISFAYKNRKKNIIK